MIDTLVIIGNGFDRWLGLDTSYSSFREYYLANRDAIIKKLHLKKISISNGDIQQNISDVELIYGNPFSPKELEEDFWGNFENSLSDIDIETINAFFGKDKKGLRNLGRAIVNAKKILREAFCQWISSIDTNVDDKGYFFGDNCLFINFNYTDTLGKAFHINPANEYHIHGEAKDKKSIIFGHSNHPYEPESVLYQLGGRFRGLFISELLLRDTDKHVHERIMELISLLALREIMDSDIKDVYVLGQSMSLPDLEYFRFLLSSTKIPDDNGESCTEKNETDSPIDDLHKRLQFSINRFGYGKKTTELTEEEISVEDKKRQEENDAFDQMFDKLVYKTFKIKDKGENTIEKRKRREADAKWHISYHGEKSKLWYEKVLEVFGYTNYELVSSIEECICEFKESK